MLDEEVTKELDPLPSNADESQSGNRRKWARGIAITIIFALVLSSISAGAYYFHIRSTPEYSMALILDAARSGNKAELERLIDTDAVVDDFVSQVLNQAAKLYGRGVPVEILKRLAESSGVITPAIKGRVEAELPGVLKKEISELSNTPFWMLVIGLDRYAVVTIEGDKAIVRSIDETDRRRITMMRSGGGWKLVAVEDEALAREVATAFGDEIMTVAKDGNLSGLADFFGVKGLGDLLNRIDGFLNR